MNDHPVKLVADCALTISCLVTGALKYLDAVVVPEFILWGSAALLLWQLLRAGFLALRWIGVIYRPDRSKDDDGTHY